MPGLRSATTGVARAGATAGRSGPAVGAGKGAASFAGVWFVGPAGDSGGSAGTRSRGIEQPAMKSRTVAHANPGRIQSVLKALYPTRAARCASLRAVDELEDLPQVLDPMVVKVAEDVPRVHQNRVHPDVQRADDIGEIVVADIQRLLGRPAR